VIVVSLLGHKQSAKIHHQLQFLWKKSGSLSVISIKCGQAATQSATCSAVSASGTVHEQTLPFFSKFSGNLLHRILADFKLIRCHLK
jgi:hypothetical protein